MQVPSAGEPSEPFQHLTLALTEAQYEVTFDALFKHEADLRGDVDAGYEDAVPEVIATREAFQALIRAGRAAGFNE